MGGKREKKSIKGATKKKEIKIIFMKSDTTVVTGTSHHLQNGAF